MARLASDLEAGAAFPPRIPQAAQVVAGIRRRQLVEIGREESGGAEKHGLGGIALGLEQGERRALGEQAHGERIPAIAEGFGGRLEQGGVAAMGIGGFQPAGGLEVGTMDGGLVQQAFDRAGREVFERMNAAPGMGDGDFALGPVQGIGELHFGNHHLRDFPVVAGADEVLADVRLENHMQHHVSERRIGRMAVRLPGAGIRIEF